MSETRMVPMTSEQYEEVERTIELLMRCNKNERAAVMMNLSIAWRFAKPAAPVLPDNVISFPGNSVRV